MLKVYTSSPDKTHVKHFWLGIDKQSCEQLYVKLSEKID